MCRFLKRCQLTRSLSDETGATTAVFSIVVLIGIMAGTFALVVDGGQLFLERRVVQNVADASALYLAQTCALRDCSSEIDTVIKGYADYNSPDLKSEITKICGTSTPDTATLVTDPLLVGCNEGVAASWRDCQTAPTGDSNFVRVRSQTRTIAGGSALSPTFARLFGDGNPEDGTWTLRGCSQAIWGAPSSIRVTTPLAISICNFVQPTSTSTGVHSGEVKAWALGSGTCSKKDLNGNLIYGTDAGVTTFILTDGLQSPEKCKIGATIKVGDKIKYATTPNAKDACGNMSNLLTLLINTPEPVYIPIFGPTEVSGGDRFLTVISFMRFKLTGYKLRPPLGCGGSTCTFNFVDQNGANYACNLSGTAGGGNDLCVVGEFFKGVPPSGNISGGSYVPSLGAFALKLIP